MPTFRVLINDNAHYMDESERSDNGVFATAEQAVAACKAIVDDELSTMWKPGTTANELYQLYIAWGPDPFVVPLDASILQACVAELRILVQVYRGAEHRPAASVDWHLRCFEGGHSGSYVA